MAGRIIYSVQRLTEVAGILGVPPSQVADLFTQHATEVDAIFHYLETPGMTDEDLIESEAIPGTSIDPSLVELVVNVYLALGLGLATPKASAG
jgi:hypothetical protein